MLLEAIAVSLVYGFFYFELTGLVGGGLIAPGYFALHFDRPWVVGFGLVTASRTTSAVALIPVSSFARASDFTNAGSMSNRSSWGSVAMCQGVPRSDPPEQARSPYGAAFLSSYG